MRNGLDKRLAPLNHRSPRGKQDLFMSVFFSKKGYESEKNIL
ncbi:hypothetical protein B4113_2052 [Geobacillus sp. B4113_201601]|nr:hypothetical protein B4113_2052 [Geobacillus sp. B4113_201601]